MNAAATVWKHLRWDLLALVLIAAVWFGYRVVDNPKVFPTETPTTSGSKPPDHSEGDVLLVLPTAPTAEADSFENLDCSFQWFNALWQHYGTVATAPADMVSPQLLAGHTVVVVPARVAFGLSSSVRGFLDEFARDGGHLVVEKPRPRWEPITGVATKRRTEQVRQVTDVRRRGASEIVERHLADVPLAGRRLVVETPPTGSDFRTAFEVEDSPGLVIRSHERGTVYALTFDYGCSLAAMHQGEPTRQMAFGPEDADRFIATSRRVGREQLAATSVPYVDILHRALFERIRQHRPIPRLWPYPAGYDGAAMSIHPAPSNTRASFGYADRAHSREAHSTLFVAADRFRSRQADLAREAGADVGLVWVLGRHRPPVSEGVGIGALEPWRRELNLPRQRGSLEAALGDGAEVDLVHTERQLWESDWDSTFRALAGSGVGVDTSFGPTNPDQFGYLFGSGMPYYPLDRRGQLFPTLEIPFAFSGANLTPQRLEQLLVDSEEKFHQPVVVNVGADAMERHPSADLLLAFRDFHDLAGRHDHWLTTVGDYTDFLKARRQSVLTSRWSDRENRLTISLRLLGVRLSTTEDGATAGLAIPSRFEGHRLQRVEIEDEPLDLEQLSASGPGDERILELPPGRHVVSAFYESEE